MYNDANVVLVLVYSYTIFSVLAPWMVFGDNTPQISLSLTLSNILFNSQEVNWENFQILIVSAVKICQQYLQTASASEGRSDPYRGFAPGPHWRLPPSRPCATAAPNDNSWHHYL